MVSVFLISFLFPFLLHQFVEFLNGFVRNRASSARVASFGIGVEKGMLEFLVREVVLHFSGGIFRCNAIALADLAEHELGEDIADTGGVICIVPRVGILHTVFASAPFSSFLEDEITLVLPADPIALDSELLGNYLEPF